MQRPDAPLVICGRQASQPAQIATFLKSANTTHMSAGIHTGDALVRIARKVEKELEARGLTKAQMKGARVLYRPAIPAVSGQGGGRFNATQVELIREQGAWLLTGAEVCQYEPGQQELTTFHLPGRAIQHIVAYALRHILSAPDPDQGSCVPTQITSEAAN